MAELHVLIERINVLRQKEFGKEKLNDEELREVFSLLAEVRMMRSGKSPEKIKAEKAPDVAAEDYF
jgi:hypothetical protein